MNTHQYQQLGKIFLRETQTPQEKRLTPSERRKLLSGAPKGFWDHSPDEPPYASPRKLRMYSPIRSRTKRKTK